MKTVTEVKVPRRIDFRGNDAEPGLDLVDARRPDRGEVRSSPGVAHGERGVWSARSRRGLGLVLRSTATSWRRTSSSMSFDDDAEPSRVEPAEKTN